MAFVSYAAENMLSHPGCPDRVTELLVMSFISVSQFDLLCINTRDTKTCSSSGTTNLSNRCTASSCSVRSKFPSDPG